MTEDRLVILNGEPSTLLEAVQCLAEHTDDLTQLVDMLVTTIKVCLPNGEEALKRFAELHPNNQMLAAILAGAGPQRPSLKVVVSNPVGHSRDNSPENRQQSPTADNT